MQQANVVIHWNEPSNSRHCPKCLAEQIHDARACPECGLLAGNFACFSAQHATRCVSLELFELARSLEGNAQDLQRHENFVARAIDEDELVFLARWYRRALNKAPDERLIQEQLSRVQSMAQAAFGLAMSRKKDVEKGPYRGALLLLAILLTMVGGAVMLTQARVNKHNRADSAEAKDVSSMQLAVEQQRIYSRR